MSGPDYNKKHLKSCIERAQKCIELATDDDDGYQTRLMDLMVHLRHWADHAAVSFDEALNKSTSHWLMEKGPEYDPEEEAKPCPTCGAMQDCTPDCTFKKIVEAYEQVPYKPEPDPDYVPFKPPDIEHCPTCKHPNSFPQAGKNSLVDDDVCSECGASWDQSAPLDHDPGVWATIKPIMDNLPAGTFYEVPVSGEVSIELPKAKPVEFYPPGAASKAISAAMYNYDVVKTVLDQLQATPLVTVCPVCGVQLTAGDKTLGFCANQHPLDTPAVVPSTGLPGAEYPLSVGQAEHVLTAALCPECMGNLVFTYSVDKSHKVRGYSVKHSAYVIDHHGTEDGDSDYDKISCEDCGTEVEADNLFDDTTITLGSGKKVHLHFIDPARPEEL